MRVLKNYYYKNEFEIRLICLINQEFIGYFCKQFIVDNVKYFLFIVFDKVCVIVCYMCYKYMDIVSVGVLVIMVVEMYYNFWRVVRE